MRTIIIFLTLFLVYSVNSFADDCTVVTGNFIQGTQITTGGDPIQLCLDFSKKPENKSGITIYRIDISGLAATPSKELLVYSTYEIYMQNGVMIGAGGGKRKWPWVKSQRQKQYFSNSTLL